MYTGVNKLIKEREYNDFRNNGSIMPVGKHLF